MILFVQKLCRNFARSFPVIRNREKACSVAEGIVDVVSLNEIAELKSAGDLSRATALAMRGWTNTSVILEV